MKMFIFWVVEFEVRVSIVEGYGEFLEFGVDWDL